MNGNRGSIAGRVVDQAGAPVAGASVAVHAGPGPVDDIAALTDADGRFRLGNLSPGRYQLAVFGAGNAEAGAQVDVGDGGASEVEIRFGGDAGPEPPRGVALVTDGIDWSEVRLIRVSMWPAGAGPDAPAKEFLFSPSSTRPATWEDAEGARYRYTASYFLDGGLQRTVGPVEGEGPLVLDQRQGVAPQ